MNERLTQFLYLLMRDHLPTGKVESIMEQVRHCKERQLSVQYSAPHLEAYARELTKEIAQ